MRLEKAAEAGNTQLFWTIALVLIKRSKTYRMAAVHKAIPFWYFKIPRQKMKRLLEKVEVLVRTDSTNLESDRVYIPKADGVRVRSLGVPRLEWRVVMTMWTVVLTLWLQPILSPSQYGARPGVGIAHAWKEILEKVVGADFVYEYDLAGFFNSINLATLHRMLNDVADLPYWVGH